MSREPRAPGDVRMDGFARRTAVPAALAWVGTNAARLPAESVAVEQAAGRVLAAGVIASIAVPEFDRAAMDGFALRGAETAGAGEYSPLEFAVRGQALSGQPFDGDVPPGTAVRIMTGGPVPPGLDAVVPAEYATEQDARAATPPAASPQRWPRPTAQWSTATPAAARASSSTAFSVALGLRGMACRPSRTTRSRSPSRSGG